MSADGPTAGASRRGGEGVLASPLRSARDGLPGAVAAAAGAPQAKTAGPPGSARDLYSSLPQEEAGFALPAVQGLLGKGDKSRTCVETPGCSLAIACIIIANTTLIGFECQDLQASHESPIYHWLEAMFVAIYSVEISLRISQIGPQRFLFSQESGEVGWNWFDLFTTLIGVLSLMVGFNASVIRLLRVLRILRIVRILKFLKDVEYTLVSAMTSMLRVMFLVLMIDFIGAVVITHILYDSEDDVVRELFGSLSSSMFHLFEVMVDGMSAVYTSTAHPSGLVVITSRVMEVHPQMWIFWVAFVFVGTISLMALVPAIFVELNLRDAEAASKRKVKEDWERRVEKQRFALEAVFHAADKDGSKTICRQEMDDFLATPDVLQQVGLAADTEDEDEDMPKLTEHLDIRQLRLEFSMVYDAIEAEGRMELSCAEFIDAFRRMRAKPMDQVVLTLQQEIFSLRTLMLRENQKLHAEIRSLKASGG